MSNYENQVINYLLSILTSLEGFIDFFASTFFPFCFVCFSVLIVMSILKWISRW